MSMLAPSRSAAMSGVEPTARPRAGGALDGQQLEVAPDAGRAPLDRRPVDQIADHVVVVDDLERPETGGADVARPERLGPAAVACSAGPRSPERGRWRSRLGGGAGHRHAGHVELGARGGGRRLGRHRRLLTARVAPSSASECGLVGASGPGNGKTLRCEGSQGSPLSRRLGPARSWHLAGVAAGRLSWLQRAGPSATLDKALQLCADGTWPGRPSSTVFRLRRDVPVCTT